MLSSKNRLRGLLCLFALLFVGASGAGAFAQEEEINLRDLARKGRTIQGWSRAPITGENKKVYDQFFSRYYFPQMVKTDPQAIEDLASMRADLFNRYLWEAHPTVQKDLTKKSYDFAIRVVGNNRFAAPIRYNAVLILGMLDEKYASKTDPNAKPMKEANTLLTKMLKLSVEQQRLPNYLQVGALVGLERHTKFLSALDDDSKKRTAGVLLTAINQEKYRPGTSRSVQYWMKLQAARAIANMGTAGGGGVFAKAVGKLVADQQANLETRGRAAMLLSQINMAGVPASVGQELVGDVKALACAVAEAEQKEAQKFLDIQSTRTYGLSSLQKSDRFRASEDGWEYARGGLIAQLEQVKTGLSAVSGLAGDDAQTITALESALQKTINVAGEKNIDFDVTDSIEAMHADVNRLVGCKSEPEAPEEEADLLGAAGS